MRIYIFRGEGVLKVFIKTLFFIWMSWRILVLDLVSCIFKILNRIVSFHSWVALSFAVFVVSWLSSGFVLGPTDWVYVFDLGYYWIVLRLVQKTLCAFLKVLTCLYHISFATKSISLFVFNCEGVVLVLFLAFPHIAWTCSLSHLVWIHKTNINRA